jgi:hypothetical protein
MNRYEKAGAQCTIRNGYHMPRMCITAEVLKVLQNIASSLTYTAPPAMAQAVNQAQHKLHALQMPCYSPEMMTTHAMCAVMPHLHRALDILVKPNRLVLGIERARVKQCLGYIKLVESLDVSLS